MIVKSPMHMDYGVIKDVWILVNMIGIMKSIENK